MFPIKWILQATSSSSLRTKLSFLKEALPKAGRISEIEKCMLCPNMCLHVCPVFDAERRLTVSPSIKSRLAYFSSGGEGIGDAIWRCLPCNACEEVCPMNISVNENLIEERGKVCELDGEPESVKLAFVSQEIHLKELEESFDKNFEEREGKLIYFPGCKAFDSPKIIHATLKILEHLKIDFAFKNVICCGSYLKELGYLKEFKEHRLKMLEILSDYEGVISNCPHCVKTLVEDYNLKAIHISQLLASKLDELKINAGISAVYHDPCILSRDLKLVEEPRKILSAIGVKISETGYNRENTYCCGFGGIYAHIDASMATKIAARRKNQLLEKSETTLTFCPRCKQALDAKDVTELIAENLV